MRARYRCLAYDPAMNHAKPSLLVAVIGLSVAMIVAGGFLIFTSAHHGLGQFLLGAVVFVLGPAGYWIRHTQASASSHRD